MIRGVGLSTPVAFANAVGNALVPAPWGGRRPPGMKIVVRFM